MPETLRDMLPYLATPLAFNWVPIRLGGLGTGVLQNERGYQNGFTFRFLYIKQQGIREGRQITLQKQKLQRNMTFSVTESYINGLFVR